MRDTAWGKGDPLLQQAVPADAASRSASAGGVSHPAYEGTDVLAASNRQVKGKDRPQRAPARKSRDKTKQDHVGDALRSIYQETVAEQVPDEFLDILGKLA